MIAQTFGLTLTVLEICTSFHIFSPRGYRMRRKPQRNVHVVWGAVFKSCDGLESCNSERLSDELFLLADSQPTRTFYKGFMPIRYEITKTSGLVRTCMCSHFGPMVWVKKHQNYQRTKLISWTRPTYWCRSLHSCARPISLKTTSQSTRSNHKGLEFFIKSKATLYFWNPFFLEIVLPSLLDFRNSSSEIGQRIPILW